MRPPFASGSDEQPVWFKKPPLHLQLVVHREPAAELWFLLWNHRALRDGLVAKAHKSGFLEAKQRSLLAHLFGKQRNTPMKNVKKKRGGGCDIVL